MDELRQVTLTQLSLPIKEVPAVFHSKAKAVGALEAPAFPQSDTLRSRKEYTKVLIVVLAAVQTANNIAMSLTVTSKSVWAAVDTKSTTCLTVGTTWTDGGEFTIELARFSRNICPFLGMLFRLVLILVAILGWAFCDWLDIAVWQHFAATQNVEGTGLGLPITRLLVEMHGGRITVTSASGEGSTFSFTLPVADVPQWKLRVE
jgi:hypothetical protein